MTADVTKNGALAKLVKAWESKNGRRAVAGAGLGLMAVSLAACGGTDSSTTPTDITTDNAAAVSAALKDAAETAGVVGFADMSDPALIAALASSQNVEAVHDAAYDAAVDLGIAVTDAMTTEELITAIVASNDPAATDAAVAGLGIAGVDTLAELFAAYNILATPPLTIGIDNYAGTDAANTINGNAAASVVLGLLAENDTFSALDVINGGDGTDTINIIKVGAITLPTNVTVTSVEIANIQSAGTVTADTSGWVGLVDLEVDAVGGATVTASTATAVNANSTGTVIVQGGAAVTVTGASVATVGTTARASGAVDATATGAVTVGANTAALGALGAVTASSTLGGPVYVYGGTAVTASTTNIGNTTGGPVTVGGSLASATGAVNVTATASIVDTIGLTTASTGPIMVIGGSTVNVNLVGTVSGGSDNVGDQLTFADVDVTGSTLTQSVTVTQSGPIAQALTVLGVGGTAAIVNGDVEVIDGNAAAAGVDSIESVTITNSGTIDILSSDLSALTLAGTTGAATIGGGTSTTKDTTLALNLNGGNSAGVTATAGTTDYATVNVVSTGANTVGGLSVLDATAINISGTGSVTLGTVSTTGASTITSTNTGGVTMTTGHLSQVFTSSDTISGNDSITLITAQAANISTGGGSDTVTIGATLGLAALDGGSGVGTVDTLAMTAAQAAAAVNDGLEAQFSNFERLSIGSTDTTATSINLANLDDINYVTSAGTGAAGTLAISGFASGGTFVQTALLDATGGATLTGALSGGSDSFTLAATGADGFVNAGTLTLALVETVNIVLTDNDSVANTAAFDLLLDASNATSVTVSGNAGIDLTTGDLTSVSTLDASAVTLSGAFGGVVFDGNNIASTITGGAGDDIFTGGTQNDVITGGLGADVLEGGLGADTFTIGNLDSGITTLTADTITDFTSGSDHLSLGSVGDATAGTGNYVQAGAAVADFTAALAAANTALAGLAGTSAATELYAFEFDAVNGYLFNDTDGDGDADQMIVMTGINNTEILAADITA
jgi:S-layer protein